MPAPFFFMLQHDSFYASAIAGNLILGIQQIIH